MPRSIASRPVAPATGLDGVAPHQHAVDTAQLGSHLVGKVVVVDRRLGGHAGGIERVEQGPEPALLWVAAVAGCAVAGVEQGEGRWAHRSHGSLVR
jgi:hypothetical protein